MKDKEFEILGDETLEARVVAWVLGEASEFEADELMRLCRERPELEVFRRRISAVHGLAGEAVRKPSVDWELTKAKRAKVLALAGARSVDDEARRDRTSRHAARRMFWGIAACLVLTVVVAGLLTPVILRAKKSDAMSAGSSSRPVSYSYLGKAEGQNGGAGDKMVDLSKMSEMPPEMLHGTPQPIQLKAPQSRERGRSVDSRSASVASVRGATVSRRSGAPQDAPVAEQIADSLGGEVDKEISLSKRPSDFSVKTDPAGPKPNRESAGSSNLSSDSANLALVPPPKTAKPSAVASKVVATDEGGPGRASRAKKYFRHESDSDEDGFMSGERFGGGGGDNGTAVAGRAGADSDGSRVAHAEEKLKRREWKSEDGGLGKAANSFGKKARISRGDATGAVKDSKSQAKPTSRLAQAVSVSGPAPPPANQPVPELNRRIEQLGPRGLAADVTRGDGLERDLAQMEVAEKLAEKSERTATLGDLPMIGRLFNGRVEEKRGRELAGGSHGQAEADEEAAQKRGSSKNDWYATPATRTAQVGGTIRNGERRTSDDFINPVEGNKLPGIPAKPGMDADQIVTGGNRSGDGAITRNSIDAILNNPERSPEPSKHLSGKNIADGREGRQAGIDVVREFVYPNEYEPPELPNSGGQAARQNGAPGKDAFPVTPATPDDFETRNTGLKTADDQSVDFQSKSKALDESPTELGYVGLDESKKAVVDRALRKQEARVEEKRKALNAIVETKGIPYTGRESIFGGSSNVDADADEERSASMTRDQLGQEKVQLDSQIKTLLHYTDDQLIEFAAGLNLPDNNVKSIKPQYDEAKTKLIALKARGLGDEHPQVRAQKEIIKDYGKQLDEAVVTLRDILETQLDLTTERLRRMETLKNDRKEDLVKRGIDANDLAEARMEFERERDKLQEMRGRMKTEDGKAAEQLGKIQASNEESRRKKADLAVDLMAEVPADKEPYSTFSLHVSDASFRVAQAALERGERPKPDEVRPEEFYNAFDYGDPAPTSGEPVACAIEQCRHPVLPGRNLVRVAVRTAAAGRGAGQPLHLTVLLDNSGSMEREDRLAALSGAVRQLASLLGPDDVVSVIGFARTPRLLADRMDGVRAGRELAGIVGGTPSEGGTNLEAALGLAGEVALRQFAGGAQNRIVLLTDGAANLGNANPESLARRIESLRLRGVAFDAAGFGTAGMNDEMLERLTRDGNGRYYVVDRVEDAGTEFAAKLAGAFRPAAENVKVQVRFNPQRVGHYRLIGFEKHRLKKEDFRDDSVDAAEMAAEEAGVAVYQVELLPGGEGEIGEVSVRFREMAKDRMVERNWTLPYEQSAPAFDEASPSMQLAGLSVLLADVLRDGPLAPLVDWHDLAPVLSRVNAEFAGNKKVGELVRMIGNVR